nr:PREDICTED: retinoid-inducible serine carboxypeptidase-like [Megachile rotundata]XP_012138025.1 PREDICTED: retinoid-inducible serine carboxypeptidase-like [Megachile rotundata]XP_012138026.1 PREDICTED: retinoid-inducible serine carboxypeptidase-like [Megachile rotundata]
MKFPILLLVALCFACGSLAKKGFGPGEQEWGYEKVRANANMFWWLYYTSANVSSYYERPLIIWLQGGPGASSTSYGNFEEIGPLDFDLEERNSTWVKNYNVLFIDNPVGTGFSYTTSASAYATTNAQIAEDLVACMKGFLQKLPQFQNVPTYITTESYGGKMGAEFALVWYKAQSEGKIKSNLRGVVLGDAWISPIDSVMTWAPFLQATGMIDSEGFKKVDASAQKTKAAVDSGLWKTATTLWSYTEAVISRATNNIDFYNILTKVSPSYRQYSLADKLMSDSGFLREKAVYAEANLDALMNGPVKKALGLSVHHGGQSNTVFSRLQEDFMKPVVDKVEMLLNQTDLKVVVLTGHLDLIVDTPGTLRWVEKLKWKNAAAWKNSERLPVVANRVLEGYVKSYGNFAMYWMNRAGHMVPKDNPNGMAQLLKAFAN